jgi:hypothetical protein
MKECYMSDKQNGNNGQHEQPQNVRSFNPNEHLMQIKNRTGAADYLPVQWRLVWFRQDCPEGTIETEIVHLELDKETEEEAFAWNNETRRSEKVLKTARGLAIVRATVKDGKGGIATGTKMEKAASFGDWLEKAETGAIGRALAALGYGTQFAPELDEQHRIVDAPVNREMQAASAESNGQRSAVAAKTSSSRSQAASKSQQAQQVQPVQPEVDPNSPMSEQQWASIRKICQHLGKDEPQQAEIINYLSAKELLTQLTQEYRQSRSKAS